MAFRVFVQPGHGDFCLLRPNAHGCNLFNTSFLSWLYFTIVFKWRLLFFGWNIYILCWLLLVLRLDVGWSQSNEAPVADCIISQMLNPRNTYFFIFLFFLLFTLWSRIQLLLSRLWGRLGKSLFLLSTGEFSYWPKRHDRPQPRLKTVLELHESGWESETRLLPRRFNTDKEFALVSLALKKNSNIKKNG